MNQWTKLMCIARTCQTTDRLSIESLIIESRSWTLLLLRFQQEFFFVSGSPWRSIREDLLFVLQHLPTYASRQVCGMVSGLFQSRQRKYFAQQGTKLVGNCVQNKLTINLMQSTTYIMWKIFVAKLSFTPFAQRCVLPKVHACLQALKGIGKS